MYNPLMFLAQIRHHETYPGIETITLLLPVEYNKLLTVPEDVIMDAEFVVEKGGGYAIKIHVPPEADWKLAQGLYAILIKNYSGLLGTS